MIRKTSYWQRIGRVLAWVAIDLGIVGVSYLITFSARTIAADLDFARGWGFIFIAAGIVIVSNYFWGIYHRLWSQSSGHEVVRIVGAAALSLLAVGLLDVLVFSPRPLPLSVVVFGHTFTLVGMVAVRYRSRLVTGLHWRWRAVWHQEFPQQTRVLIVGAGEAGQTLAWRLKYRWHRSREGKDYEIVGFVDDDPRKQGMYVEGCRVLGTRQDIPRLVEEWKVDLLLLAIHNISGPVLREILGYCERTGARIKMIPDAFASLNATHGVPLLRDIRPEDILGRKPIEWHESVNFEPVTGRVVLVTGAAGSIGSEICRQILTFVPSKLLLLDNNESDLYDLLMEIQLNAGQTTLVPCLVDVMDQRALDALFLEHRPQVVFHAAAFKHVPMLELYPYQAIRVNLGGTWSVAERAQRYEAERFVLISTDKAVNPSSVMGASKRLCEILVQALAAQRCNRTLFTSVRFGNVLGSRGSVVPLFNRQIDRGGPVTVTHPEMTRYFMTIPEAVNLVIHAACITEGHGLYMLCMGEQIRILDLAERMIRMRGLLPYEDIPIVFTGVRPGEKLHEQLAHDSETVFPTVHPHIVRLEDKEMGALVEGSLEVAHHLLTHCGPDCHRLAGHTRALAGDQTSSTNSYCLECMKMHIQKAYSAIWPEPRMSDSMGNSVVS